LTVCLDTSVLIAAFTEEADSDRAQAILERVASWRVSDWATAEFSAAIRVKARRGELALGQVFEIERILDEMILDAEAEVAVEPDDHIEARRLIIDNGRLRAPDALHIAVAARIGAELATFDRNLARAAEAAGVPVLQP
jgi:predicted nucleic acid-binding protein